MATLDVKFTKFDNRPWGFRLAGGSDFPEPLTVIRVTEGSLAECMGLKVGDVVVKLNDQWINDMTHGQAHEALVLAGNNFVLGVRRTEDPYKTLEGIEEKIEPYMLPLEEILFAPIEEKRESTPDEVPQIEDEFAPLYESVTEKVELEIYPAKPCDENSEIVANTNLTDEEIAQLILDEEELLDEKGILGVNFKKLRPRAPLIKQSKVFQELQQQVNSEPQREQELKRRTTFLQKPERPVPQSRLEPLSSEPVEPYRVVIQKQPRRPVSERLARRGPSEQPRPAPTPGAKPTTKEEPDQELQQETKQEANQEDNQEVNQGTSLETNLEANQEAKTVLEKTTVTSTSETDAPDQNPKTEFTAESQTGIIEPVESVTAPDEDKKESQGKQVEAHESQTQDQKAELVIRRPSTEVGVEVAVNGNRDKVRELVTTEISLERQLESVQSQLLALKQLPSEIEKHLAIVTDQLHKIMELSGVEKQTAEQPAKVTCCWYQEQQVSQQPAETVNEQQQPQEQEQFETEDGRHSVSSNSSSYAPHLISTEDTWTEFKELEISVKSNEDDGKKVKKYIVSYESKVIEETQNAERSGISSPALSHGSFEPDPKLTLQEQLVQELKHRKGRKPSRELWHPQAKQLELTYGRKWRCPNDFFNDEMIADALCSQAEVIRGRALGVNFKKFEKTALPNYDHLMNSSVFKMIHKMEAEPKKGIPARPPKVIAAEDIIERVNTPVCCMANDRSVGNVSH